MDLADIFPLMKIDPGEIGKRLQKAARAKSLETPTKLARAVKAAGFGTKLGAIKTHWYGTTVPNGMNCIAYQKTLDVSIDWLLTGQQPGDPHDWQELVTKVEQVATAYGLTFQLRNERFKEIQDLVSRMEPRQLDKLKELLYEFLQKGGKDN